MSDSPLIAVLDVGKTHARLLLIDGANGQLVSELTRACSPIASPHFRELDIAGTESWLFDVLASSPERGRIDAIVPIAHGAAAVLINQDGAVLAAPDYEDGIFEAVSPLYDPRRDRFADSYSPGLPRGLNLGRQWYFLQEHHRALWDQAHHALLYPQYWAWRFCGVAASELTSLGCHSDLWRPQQSRATDLAVGQGWADLLPPVRFAGEALGPITPAISRATGLGAKCRVYCGLHDSNASYLSLLAGQRTQGSRAPDSLSVISSGTWTVVFAQGTPLRMLREERDMLANIDAYGNPVATARFMGGREFAEIAGPDSGGQDSGPQVLGRLIENQIMALPSFSPEGGPFAMRKGSFVHGHRIAGVAERAALATLYTALMSELLLENLGARGDVLIDGPLARSRLFASVLQTLRPAGKVRACSGAHGAASAALFLVSGLVPAGSTAVPVPMLPDSLGLQHYRDDWRRRLEKLG